MRRSPSLKLQHTSNKERRKKVMGAMLLTGDASATSTAIQTAITNAATSVQTDALSMITAIVPVAAPVIAAVIVVSLGFKLIRRFMRG